MNKRNKIIFIIVKVLFTIIIMIGTVMYFTNHELVASRIANLGYPTYIIYPLGILKLLGLMTIWISKSVVLKEWAYSGLLFVLVLGVSAHVSIQDNEYLPALMGLIFGLISYVFHRKEQNIKVVLAT